MAPPTSIHGTRYMIVKHHDATLLNHNLPCSRLLNLFGRVGVYNSLRLLAVSPNPGHSRQEHVSSKAVWLPAGFACLVPCTLNSHVQPRVYVHARICNATSLREFAGGCRRRNLPPQSMHASPSPGLGPCVRVMKTSYSMILVDNRRPHPCMFSWKEMRKSLLTIIFTHISYVGVYIRSEMAARHMMARTSSSHQTLKSD